MHSILCLSPLIENNWPNLFFLIYAYSLGFLMKFEGVIWGVRWAWGDWWGYRWNKISLKLIIVETGQLVYGNSLNVLSTFVCCEIFHNKNVIWRKYYLLVSWNWVFYPVANLEALWTASSFVQLRVTLVPVLCLHSPLPPFCYSRISHYAPWGQTRNCNNPNPRLEEGSDSGYLFLHPPLASCRWSWKLSLILTTKG